ncbi:hypothetical protein HI914_01198 [Erysiphe necator]|nr:hypothetical protein HI914_01198 [Erysiphe necator]
MHVKRCYEEHENEEEPSNEENSNEKKAGKDKDLNKNNILSNISISPKLLINKQTPLPILRSSANQFHATRAQLCTNLVNNNEDIFVTSHQKELRGLLDMNVFEPVPLSSIPQGTRIFGSRFFG